MAHIIRSDEVTVEVCKALGLDPGKVRRVVLDLNIGSEPLTAYVEMYGDERFLNLKWELDGVRIEYPDGLSGEAEKQTESEKLLKPEWLD